MRYTLNSKKTPPRQSRKAGEVAAGSTELYGSVFPLKEYQKDNIHFYEN
jgi:hypothetical protein